MACMALCLFAFCVTAPAAEVATMEPISSSPDTPFWVWPTALFCLTFCLGIVAVMGGVGGGVLFVPIVSGFFPFHMDFVRGTGLMIALAGSLTAGPTLLRSGMVNLRLALPLALIGSISSIAGAMMGLALPQAVVQTALGLTILGIVALMWLSKKSDFPNVPQQDALGQALKMHGIYHEHSTGKDYEWKVHRTPLGMALFVLIGMLAGLFGLGAGWANVPVINLVMGAPLKVSVASSHFLLSIVDTSAAWIYLNRGAVLAIITVPSIAGIMLGTRIGVMFLKKMKAGSIRKIVITILFLAGLRSLLKGTGIWV